MQVREAMSDDVRIANPNQSIRDAAILMAKIDAGSLPVGDNDRLVGMITDRDIAVRAVALGKGPDTPVRDVMSQDVKYCFEDDDVGEVAQNMADIKVRRLPVLNKSKRLVGIVSLGDLALADGPANAGEALCGISEPGGEHSQSRDGACTRALIAQRPSNYSRINRKSVTSSSTWRSHTFVLGARPTFFSNFL